MAISSLAKHEVMNVACGDQITLNQMINLLQDISFKSIKALYGAERLGDVRHSRANITKIQNVLGYNPIIRFREGLEIVYSWYKEKNI